MNRTVASAGAVVAGVAALVASQVVGSDGPSALAVAPSGIGLCGLAQPPEPDPCDAVNGIGRWSLFDSAVPNSKQITAWKRDNPGEWARLTAFLAAPNCPTPANPRSPLMLTFMGALLIDAAQMIACSGDTSPVVIGDPNPPPAPGSSDRRAPTPPGITKVEEVKVL